MTIERLTAESALNALPDLIALLQDTVNNGGTVGFLPPLSASEAESYWRKVIDDVSGGARILLGYRVDGHLAGSVQLELAMRSNGLHRAEVQKVIVHRDYRRQGIGQQLMEAIEAEARKAGRSLLVLDTRQGDSGEGLYRKVGFIEAGVIPQFARNADGSFHATVLYYKLLQEQLT